MVFKNPYGFLIKHFKLIHLILTGLFIYLTVKVNGILQYYNNFIDGFASKLDAINYITDYYMIAIGGAIVICGIIYALMRYKKKPRMLYLLLIVFLVIVTFMIEYAYAGLETIYISVLDSRSLLLYRDLLRILVVFQYVTVGIVLVRGLGFDIKKFNFVQDLEDLGIDVTDEEEVELTLSGTEAIGRKLHRNLRELKYYYLENKIFILIIIGIVLIFLGGGWFIKEEVVDKKYQQGEIFSTTDFQFQVLDSFITNRDYSNKEIMSDDTSFVIIRMNVGSNGDKRQLNTSNLILDIGSNQYASERRYAARFIDLGTAYRDDKIGKSTTYVFIYHVENDYLEEQMKLVYANDETVILEPIMLDEVLDSKNYDIGDSIDLSASSLGSGSFKISSFEVQEKFSYPYQYEIGGQVYTNQLSITSVYNTIMNLKIDGNYSLGLEHYSFLEQYAELKYKKGDNEYVSKVFDNKTPGNYKEGLYLGVDKEIEGADSIWFEIRIRNQVYRYNLK